VWDPMHRRRFLAHLAALSSTAMLAPFGVFQAPQRSERLQKVLDGQVRVDDASIAELATRVDSLRRLDKRFGARRVYPLVLEQLEELRGIEKAGVSAELLPGLLGVTAEATMLAGWQLLDLQMLPESGEYYRLAVVAAHAAGDRMLEGYALADSAHVLVTAGLTMHASSTLEHAARLVGEGAHRQLQSWLASMQADTSGRAGDERGVKDALDRAEQALAKESSELAPLYISDFDIAHLQRWRGRGLLHLRQNSPAQTALEEAVRLEYETDFRGKAASLAELTKAYAANREIDQAAKTALETLRLARETNSLRNEQRVHEVRPMLEPWRNRAAVVELDEHLHADH
jgi:tetratricopeptide (TPR) repeat protein